MPHNHEPPPINRTRARAMRKDSTRAENLLWQVLRGGKLEGFKFRRQVPMHNYVLDFVCFDAKVIIEVDGAQHADSDADARRDAYFRGEGFVTLRFWNDEIERNLDFVCLCVLDYLRGRQSVGRDPSLAISNT
ncbi:endonuclease domain-containing protein [Agrobacterium larrymoorei]|uniref:Endonuclease domain-containing protein n=1 Tax=Agrobacterium larrymoorei TaxID=160699 RepID=A0A4D7DP76_9HYPH|nr:DUF559 domain-containing protein [Agrobacterium larrymoorei]QCI97637.1 endonuclease domain-containing protein [Agrobacterium larrymoorei]QYA06916.1 endonuclease domain-containing protein [Agrobacterium larrymoorei]